MKFGMAFEGTEEKFEAALRALARHGEPFTYLEIGVFKCLTFQAVCAILESTAAKWRAIGIDPAPETRDAFNLMMKNKSWPAELVCMTRDKAFAEHSDQLGSRLDFVLIDGCHSEPCVTGDFLSVEPLIRSGGLVVFHDFCDWNGLPEVNAHCGRGIGVLPAVQKLGLLENSRPGWKRLPDWETDMTTLNWPCGVFEKV